MNFYQNVDNMEIPVRKYLLVKQEEEQEKTQSGVYIPEDQRRKSNVATIERVG